METSFTGKKISMYQKAFFVLLAFLCILVITQREVTATEFGGGAYPNGAECFMAGAVPPPGTYFLNYVTHLICFLHLSRYKKEGQTDYKNHTYRRDCANLYPVFDFHQISS